MISSTICAAAMKKQAHLESLFAFLRLHIATAFLQRKKQTLFSFEHTLRATRHNFQRFVIVKRVKLKKFCMTKSVITHTACRGVP